MVDDLVLGGELVADGVLDDTVIRRMVAADRDGVEDRSKEIWQLLTLETWYRGAKPARVTGRSSQRPGLRRIGPAVTTCRRVGAGPSPPRARISASPKTCQVTKADTGLPGNPSQCALPMRPTDTGLPGLIATPLNSASPPNAMTAGFT